MDPDDFEFAMSQVTYIEDKLRLPKGFVAGLLNEADWGFVIKLHAVFESLLNVSISDVRFQALFRQTKAHNAGNLLGDTPRSKVRVLR